MAQKPKAAPAKPAPAPARRPPPAPPRGAAPARQAPPPPQRAAPPQQPPQRPPQQAAEQQARGGALAVQGAASQMPAHLRERAAQSTGQGVSSLAEDNLIPMIYILQEQSPQCQSRDPKYVEGAVAGNFWLRGTTELLDGERDGMVVQPCAFKKAVIEWGPERGSFIARHETMPDHAEQVQDPNDPNKKSWVDPQTGNRFVDVREHIVRVFLPDGRRIHIVMPFTSTGHSVSRGWMTDMNQKQFEGQIVDSTMLLYRLHTKWTTNKKGSWFMPSVKFEGWVEDPADIEAGDALFHAFAAGDKVVDTAGYGDGGTAADDAAQTDEDANSAGRTGGI